ncbi:MAG: hypothetical protein NC200_04725 [Candidatus Gastranaerophilales bacterium]|nr:hypothetical protein [Candidatus Gastranaerophilales bacterium]
MGFEIGKNVQSGGITLDELQAKLNGKVKDDKVKSLFDTFNTNQTTEEVNGKQEQVLDQTEQVALMSFFKEIAGGKKGKADDTNLGRGDLRNFKKNNKTGNFSFIQNLGYGDMKKIMAAFTGVVEDNANDNQEITEWGQTDGQVNTVKIGGKEYKINEDNTVSDADGVKYEYKDGKLTKQEDGDTTTTFDKGVRNQAVESKTTVTIDGTTYPVENGKVKVGETEYDVVDGKVKVGEKEYTVDTKETTTKYRADGNTLEQTVVNDSASDTVTTTNFRENGTTIASTIVEDNKNKTITTTNFQPNGKTKAKEVVVNNSNAERPVTTTTNYNTSGALTNRTIVEGKEGAANIKTTKINYSTKSQTITQGDITTEETFVNYNAETGDVSGADSNISKRVATNKADHTRTTTEPATKPTVRTVELLDDNNDKVQRTVKFDKSNKTATFTVDAKTITLATDSSGNILANAKFTGTRMETVGEAAIRLGFAKGTPEYNAIVQKNGGANKHVSVGGNITIPDSVANLRGINTEKAVVDAKQQKKLYAQYQEKLRLQRELNAINTRIANAPARAQELARSLESGKGGVRQTYATANHKVYCANFYNTTNSGGAHVNHQDDAGANDWQQHYVYNPITDKMDKLEDVMDNCPSGAHVKYITDGGYATLTNGQTVKISFSNFDNKMTRKVSSLSTQYEKTKGEFSAAMAADVAASVQAMPEMKDIDGNVIARTASKKSGDPNQITNATLSQVAADHLDLYSIDFWGDGHNNNVASIEQSHGVFSGDAHLKIRNGFYAGDWKFIEADGDNLNYDRFSIRTNMDGSNEHVSVGDYNVTKLRASDGRELTVRMTEGGAMQVNANGTWYNLEKFVKLQSQPAAPASTPATPVTTPTISLLSSTMPDLSADETYLNTNNQIINTESNLVMIQFKGCTVETITDLLSGQEVKAVKSGNKYYDWNQLKSGIKWQVCPKLEVQQQ